MLQRVDQRLEIAPGLFSDPPTGLLRLLNFLFSVISVLQMVDQRSEIALEVFSDPPSGLLRILKKVQ